jgi:hypothetical protein
LSEVEGGVRVEFDALVVREFVLIVAVFKH